MAKIRRKEGLIRKCKNRAQSGRKNATKIWQEKQKYGEFEGSCGTRFQDSNKKMECSETHTSESTVASCELVTDVDATLVPVTVVCL